MSKVARAICRIGTALIALMVVPNMIWNTLVYMVIDPGLGEESPALWGEELSLSYLYQLFGPNGPFHGAIQAPEGGFSSDLFLLLRPALVSFTLIALAVLVLLAIAVIAIVSNKRKVILILAACGFPLMGAANLAFGVFANKVLAPEFNLLNLLGTGTLTGILGMFVDPQVVVMDLSRGVSTLILLFGLILLWIGAFELTKPKKEKK
ncbi:MAG: hypothetical protein LBB67_03005 [Oscillospiraceae bacterium]|jgi:hypothetical protein|nr:hypothetical protein [Oscillospiraceae bacterium]